MTTTPDSPADVVLLEHDGTTFVQDRSGAGFVPVPSEIESHLCRLDLDLSEPHAATLLSLFVDDIEHAVRLGAFESSLDPVRKRKLSHRARLFVRWCEYEHGVDVVAEHASLRDQLAVEWLVWMGTEIDDNHPLLQANSGEKNSRRGSAKPVTTMEPLIGAVQLLCEQHDLPPVRFREAPARRAHGQTPVRARPFSVEEITEMAKLLRSGSIEVAPHDAIIRDLWHASNHAALLVYFWTSLRLNERLLLLDCHTQVLAEEARLVIQMVDTKQNLTGRQVILQARGDELCPVAAVAGWLDMAHANGMDRRGLLIPSVNLRDGTARVGTDDGWLRECAAQLGIDVVLRSNERISSHGLRRSLPTIASRQGTPLRDIQRHLGHSNPHVTALYTAPRDDVVASELLLS